MNELLQKHGCANVFSVPEGLKELMSDITREVLREQPPNIFDFVANYLSVLLITREHGILSLKILDDLCDCKPSVSEHLMQLGMEREQADMMAQIIKEKVEEFEPVEGKEKVKEMQIIKKILTRSVLDEDMAAKVCQVARNAYRDYWYRKKLLEQTMKVQPDDPWEIAAEHTLELYKRTKPSFSELTRATQKIQAAYRGYYVRKNLLNHLKPKRKKQGPKVDLLGPPIDIAASREIDLGPIIDIKVREDDVSGMFNEYAGEKLGLKYDPMKTITHVEDEEVLTEVGPGASKAGPLVSTKSLAKDMQSAKSIGRDIQSAKSMAGGVSMATGVDTKSKMRQDDIEGAGGPRQSRLVSIAPEPRQSRVVSQLPDLEQLHKISFAEQPPEVIPNETGADEGGEVAEVIEAHEVQEVQEEPVQEVIEAAEAVEGEPALEVPEDIPDDRTEGDGESAPTASAPSSAPDTADNTDVEDAGDTDAGETDGGATDAGGTDAGGTDAGATDAGETTGEDEGD